MPTTNVWSKNKKNNNTLLYPFKYIKRLGWVGSKQGLHGRLGMVETVNIFLMIHSNMGRTRKLFLLVAITSNEILNLHSF